MDLVRAREYFEKVNACKNQSERKKMPIPKVNISINKMLRDFIIFGETDLLMELDLSSYENKFDSRSFLVVDGVAFFSNRQWTYYFSDDWESLKKETCGKWMYFYNDLEFAKKICQQSIKEGVCLEAKHANSNEGVCCFYINGDNQNAHKRVIRFLLDNDLIRKTAENKYYNVAFKYDDQTLAEEYGAEFIAKIKLDNFINLETGEWK